jgi:hypothetical protein
MGGGGSQTIEQTFDLTAINKTIFNQIVKNQQSLAARLDNRQTLKLKMDYIGSGCVATIGQTIDATSTVDSVMEPKTVAEAKTAVNNELSATAQAALEKSTEFGNMQFGDKQNVRQRIDLEVQNVVENTFTTENINKVVSDQVNVQDADLEIGYCDGTLNFNQDIVAQLAASAITKSLASAIADNDVLNALSSDAGASAKTENKGFADLIDSIGEAFSGPFKYAIIASVVCVCLIVVLLVVMGLSPAGQSATKNLGAAGASRLGRRF